jgi:uncharacterized membrane protein HdeD (DUF308 family)
MANTTHAAPGSGWGWLLASGLAAIVLGAFALLFPFPATYAATVVVATLFLVMGAFALVGAAQGRGHERRGFLIVYGILAIIAGALIFLFPISGAVALTMVATAWIAARGVLEIAAGVRSPKRRWPWILLGVVNLILAAMVWLHLPWAALALPGVLLGVSLLMSGMAEVMAALAHKRGTPAAAPA